MQHEDLLKLDDWNVSITESDVVVASGRVGDFDEFQADVTVSVEGDTPSDRNIFIYLLQIDEHKTVAVIHRADAVTPAGSHVRIPTQGWLATKIRGRLVVVGSRDQVRDEEWPVLLGGRDGDMGDSSGRGSVVVRTRDSADARSKSADQERTREVRK
jgi:hypothetical protein